MRFQLWHGRYCVVDMECDTHDSDNTAVDFIKSVAHWLKAEPRADYEILMGLDALN